MPFILENILKYPKHIGIPIHCPQLHSFYHSVTASFLLGEERREEKRKRGRKIKKEGRWLGLGSRAWGAEAM